MKFSAMLLLREVQPLSISQIQSELTRIAPQARFGDWASAPELNASSGTSTIVIDDEPMSVVVVSNPAEVTIVEREHFANHIWTNAEADAAEHAAYFLIAATRDTVDQTALLKQARAVTLLAAVIARLVPFIGIKWVDGSNCMEARQFVDLTKNIGQPDRNVVPLWVRIMHYKTPEGTIGGTLGLHYFGFADLEYATGSLDLGTVMSHAYLTAEMLLRSGKPLPEGKIEIEGQSDAFKLSYKREGGIFVPHAVAYISTSSGKKNWWKW
jgi:hypothetical protein